MADHNKKFLMDLMQRPGNDLCADCGSADNQWASYNLGIFICTRCAGVHRSLGAHISKVKSVGLDRWDDDQVKMMEVNGNLRAQAKYENMVPMCYKRPTSTSVQVVREQWIRGKYERLEFMDPDKQDYLTGEKEGYLWKRGKEDSRFQSRRFVLSMQQNKLEYYNRENAKDPKAVIRLDEINATFVPDKIGNINGLQLTYPTEKETRNLFVFAEEGKDIVDWYNAIRTAKLNRLRIGLPTCTDEELVIGLSRDFVLEGWLSKKGPRPGDAYKRRWCTLDDRLFMYLSDPLSANPCGEFGVGHTSAGYCVRSGVPAGTKEKGYGFSVITPNREYTFSAETDSEREDWVSTLRGVMERELTPHDINMLAKYSGKS